MSIHGNLATLSYGSTSGVGTSIAARELSMPDVTYASIDATDLSDVAMVKIPGIPDNGSISFKLQHTAANFTLIGTLAAASKWYKVQFSDAKGYLFQGFLNKFKAGIKNNELAEWDCSIEISGAITQVTS